MIGFRVNFRGKIIDTAIPDGVNSIIAGKRDNKFYLDACGMDKGTQAYYRWCYTEDLILGEEIDITRCDIEQISEPMDQKEYQSFFQAPEQQTVEDVEKINRDRVKYFHALENILQKEGLL